MVQKGAIEEEIKPGKDGTYHILHTSLHWVVNSGANALFSIFAIYLTLVCNFLHHLHWILKFGVNQIFHAVFLLITHSSTLVTTTFKSRKEAALVLSLGW